MALHLPSPPVNGFHVGPAFIHFYGLMYVIGITAAILITQRRWKAQGGDPALVGEVAIWGVPAGIIGGRIYFDITTPKYIPHHWYGLFAVWDGGISGQLSPQAPTLFAAWRPYSAAGAALLWRDAGEGLLHMLAAASPGDLLTAVADSRAAHPGPPRSGKPMSRQYHGGYRDAGLSHP